MSTPNEIDIVSMSVKLFNGLWELYKMGVIYAQWTQAKTCLSTRFIIIDKCANQLKQDDYNLYQAFVMAYDVIHPENKGK